MIKNFSLVLFLFVSTLGYTQKESKEAVQESIQTNAGTWQIDLGFGTTKLYNTPKLSVIDNIIVGLNLGVTRQFSTNFYTAAGITFSTLKNAGGLWENYLNYFSANLSGGYVFNNLDVGEQGYQFATPFLGIGTSFISAPNTIKSSSTTMSANFTGGVIFWFRESNFGLVMQDTYKMLPDNSSSMVSHNQFTIGLKYKL
ncbi:hypothetical protein [Polaribacter glomeratus]|uniref:Outer membrane protein beta-barrel domain-containing protein n=1 Tax=Polaribacter glomeratus TaxID=102 RepID=A0A2S7WWF7_9FLAO|nr:hypothetical protein [Polaribacter glomeratus]PQJ81934.1 hypothetical protein BTO16_04815 [Polaribacter glomeratus]TXD64423.1 hypothetical protein ESX12_14985 [Polaribacter glomeratus]